MMWSNHTGKALQLWAVLCVFCLAGAGVAGAAEAAANDPMRYVPADALFCVRINKLDTTLGQVDQFLTGIFPKGLSMPVRTRMSNLLGSPEPVGVDMSGDFAVFGPLPGGEEPDLKRFGILVPVTDYQQFLSNPNVTAPDAQGVSKIGPQGQQRLVAVSVGGYALVSAAANQQALVDVKTWISGAGTTPLAQRLSADELKRATSSPAWAYANIQTVSKTFGPMLQEKMKEAKKTFQQMQAAGQPMMGQMDVVMDAYMSMLNNLMQETQFVSLSLDPSASVIRTACVAAAVPDTEMARILSMDGAPQPRPNLLGYLENGAVMTGVATFSPALLKALTLEYMDFLDAMMRATASHEDIAQIRQLMTDSADALGGALAWSFAADLKNKPPFEVRYVATLRDKQKFYQVLEQASKLMNEDWIADFYKQLGMTVQFDLKRNVETYKDVPIDAIHFAMLPADTNTPQAQMIKQIYGAGFDLRLAAVNNLLLYAMSADPQTEIHALIDQAKAGEPGPVPSEIQAALNLLPEARTAEFFGTYNILRLIQMGLAFAPVPMPQIDVPSQSNIAYAGDIGGGKLQVTVAVPKQHVLELMAAFMKIQQQKMQEMQQQQQQQKQRQEG
jgi:hypothetical protein